MSICPVDTYGIHLINWRSIRVGRILRKHLACRCGHAALPGSAEEKLALAALAETERVRTLRFGEESGATQGVLL